MITVKDKKLSITEKKSKEKEVYKYKATTYDKGKLKFTINSATGKAWRLVHNGVKVIALIEGSDKDTTGTIYEVAEFDTEKTALAGITKLGLIFDEEEFEISTEKEIELNEISKKTIKK